MNDNISIGVMSSFKYKNRYNAIKNTWGKDFKRIFYFGGERSDINDLIKLNYVEEYESILYMQHDIYKYLYEKNSDSEWYCVINDDAVLFDKNIEFTLSKYDSKKDLYLGTSNYKSDILPLSIYLKNEDSELSDMYYASGGPGFFLSNSLMNKISNCVDEMLSMWLNDFDEVFKYPLCIKHIDAGLAYQLYKKFNIKVTDINNEKYRLYTQSPDFYLKNENKLCENPMGFHYIDPVSMYNLYNLYKK